jgi:hypothetical protein
MLNAVVLNENYRTKLNISKAFYHNINTTQLIKNFFNLAERTLKEVYEEHMHNEPPENDND